MDFYEKHVFFCINKRENGRKCCADADSQHHRDYMKARLKAMGMHGKGLIRVNTSGCLGRCAQGPTLVIYPEGVWYTYANVDDLDEIIQEHLVKGKPVTRLLMPEEK